MAMFDVDQDMSRLWRGYLSWRKQNPDTLEPNRVDWLRKPNGEYRLLKPSPNNLVSLVAGVPYGGMMHWLSYWRSPGEGSRIELAHPGVPAEALRRDMYSPVSKHFTLKEVYSVALCACDVSQACSCTRKINPTLPDRLVAELRPMRKRSGRIGVLADAFEIRQRKKATP